MYTEFITMLAGVAAAFVFTYFKPVRYTVNFFMNLFVKDAVSKKFLELVQEGLKSWTIMSVVGTLLMGAEPMTAILTFVLVGYITKIK